MLLVCGMATTFNIILSVLCSINFIDIAARDVLLKPSIQFGRFINHQTRTKDFFISREVSFDHSVIKSLLSHSLVEFFTDIKNHMQFSDFRKCESLFFISVMMHIVRKILLFVVTAISCVMCAYIFCAL